MASPPRVCEHAVLSTAGRWIVTFRQHNWEGCSCNNLLYALLHTKSKHGHSGLLSRAPAHTSTHARTQTQSQSGTYRADSRRLCIPLSPQVSETDTKKQRGAQCTALSTAAWNHMAILHLWQHCNLKATNTSNRRQTTHTHGLL